MNKVFNKRSRSSVVSSLYKEFKKLEEGKNIIVKFDSQIPIDVNISWQSDTSGEISYSAEFLDDIDFDGMVHKKCLPTLNSFNTEIKKFIAKCDNYAFQFGEDKHKFFEEMMDYGMKKDNAKIERKNIKKEIIQTEKKLQTLKSKLQHI